MKNCYALVLVALVLISPAAFSQEQPVRFARGNFVTGNNVARQVFQKTDLSASLAGDHYFVLIQFSVLPSKAIQDQLRNAGIILGEYIPGNAYLATIQKDIDLTPAAGFGIIAINTLPAFFKTASTLFSYDPVNDQDNSALFAVNYYTTVSRSFVQTELQKAGAVIVPTKFTGTNVVFIQPSKAIIQSIATLPFISYISLQRLGEKMLNYKSVAMHAISGLFSAGGRGLRGSGVTVGVGDNADITTHADFTARVINRVYNVPSLHGTHVTGTVAGGGIVNPKFRGMAPKATIVSQWFSDIITNTPVYVTDHDMIATNNSYYTGDDSCAGNSAYDVLSNYIDNQVRDYEKVLHVVSAGNDGSYTCSPYTVGYATIKSGWQTAKNVITVGAIDSNYLVTSFSSRGPVNDGRIKPEIVANGFSVISTRTNNLYVGNSGTSMSGPIVAGAAALLNERYRQLNSGAIPKASLIKALLCNTAEDLAPRGPDFTFGFGMLNARRAVEAMENNQYLISSTAPNVVPLVVPAGVRRLKVMLYWADTAAAPLAGSTLVNDLDLTVTVPATHYPLILDPSPANVNMPAFQGADHRNNIEQVVIDSPAVGPINLNVSSFAAPYGPQEYILTWQMDMNGITVEYPYGGEMMIPGETETIRWSAYGDETNTFTVEYFDGTSWNLISNTVAANARSLNWVVPATISNNYRVRVSRNTSVLTGQSDHDFVVIGQPVLTVTVPCEGFVQLDWPAITGATSYDIWQLKGDSMEVIGDTTALTYMVSGLNNTTAYWFGVSAKNGSVTGRRSLSRIVVTVPSASGCTLGPFDNNFKAVSINAPVTGREFTSSAFTGTERVSLTIKNLDNAASSGSYDLFYRINSNPAVMETISTVVNSLGTLTHQFAPDASFLSPGIYTITAWVKRTGDVQPLDDTVTITIKNLANPALVLPLLDGFETTTAKDYSVNTIGLDGDDRADFKTNTIRGRARTFVNTGFARTGNRAVTLDQFPASTSLTTDSLLMTFNGVNYNAGNQLRLDFHYKNHGQDNNPNNKVWIRGSDTQPWILAYNLVANQAALGEWKQGVINVNDVLDTVIPAQPITSSFQVKFGQQAYTSANIPYPDLDQDDGYTFDDIKLEEAINDIAITAVLSPSITGCAMAGPQTVSLEIKNYSSTTFTNVPVYYSVNGGTPVSEAIASLPPGVSIHTFLTGVSLGNNADYSFDFWLNEPSDSYNENDSILDYQFHTSPVISSYPYLEGFESGPADWYQGGYNSSWQWGTPTKTLINKAANGTRAWVTGLASNYNSRELSYLYSPCFDLSGLTQPVLSFSHIFKIEDGTPTDFTWVEYSDNGGVTWNRLGTNALGVGTNWYNDPTGAHRWRTSFSKWHVASIDIPTNGANTRFRIVMSSNEAYSTEGVGIDDIHVFDKALVYTGTPVTGLTQTVSGSSWFHFTSGGRRVVSINPNGQNLGSTTVDVYPYSGAVRTRNNQYYLNRNIVIRPATQPGAYVSVRFYFTDTEAKSLIAATGCAPCTKPGDPYELGVTKYSGTAIQENGTLDDNYGGAYSFVLPANTEIIPYDNGYYAEYPANSFSEFWLNNGGIGNIHPLPVSLVSFEAIKQNNQVLLQWDTREEGNLAGFTIERTNSVNVFQPLGTVIALNQPGTNRYNFTDLQPLKGLNLYRLKLTDRDGTYKYSAVRRIDFTSNADDITVYPNPVTDSRIYIASSGNTHSAVLYDAAGKKVRNYLLQGRNNLLDLSAIAKGVYQLKIVTDNSVQFRKIIIQ